MIPYVPSAYRSSAVGNAVLWTSPNQSDEQVVLLRTWIAEATVYASDALGFTALRRLHVVSFLTNEEARRALDRCVPPSMALAPYSGSSACLVVVQSPQADPTNGDPVRMTGLLVHEIVHQLIAEKSGSRKMLGDGNRSVNVSPGLNEGIAEIVRLRFLARGKRVDELLGGFAAPKSRMTFQDVDEALEDLAHGRRAEAFARATGAAAWLARQVGVPELFERLRAANEAVPPSSECGPQALERLVALLRPGS